MKLNLGCGKKLWSDFENVDIPGSGAPVEMDIRKLTYDDNSADEIHAIHVVEHFYLYEVHGVLTEWRRVLKRGGLLAIEVPCWDKVVTMIKAGVVSDQMTRWPLHGDPRTHRSEADVHKWCWAEAELMGMLTLAGYNDIVACTPKFHVASRDMRIEARK